MSLSIHERHLIDRYLNGELSGIELEEFNQKLIADADFKKTMELQQLIYAGVAHAREEEIREKISASIKYRKPGVPFPLKLIIAFLLIIIFGITFWSYVGNDFDRLKPYNNFISLFKRKDKEVLPERASTKLPIKSTVEQQDSSATDVNPEDSTSSSSEHSSTTDTTLYEDDIEVKKDVLVFTKILPLINKSTQHDESLSKETAQKLPDADLPVDENADSLTVEFWVSPIHYKGYKMSKNKVILFGMENIEALKLYRLNKDIYMDDGESFYQMAITYDFMPYQKLKDSEIPRELK